LCRADLRLDLDQDSDGPTHCRKELERRLLQQGHFADGGYVDNEGLLTAVEWLRRIMELSEGQSAVFDRVLILRILPFAPDGTIEHQQIVKSVSHLSGQMPSHEKPEHETAEVAAPGRSGWLNEFFGPVQTLVALRGTSQNERNSLVLDLFSKHY